MRFDRFPFLLIVIAVVAAACSGSKDDGSDPGGAGGSGASGGAPDGSAAMGGASGSADDSGTDGPTDASTGGADAGDAAGAGGMDAGDSGPVIAPWPTTGVTLIDLDANGEATVTSSFDGASPLPHLDWAVDVDCWSSTDALTVAPEFDGEHQAFALREVVPSTARSPSRFRRTRRPKPTCTSSKSFLRRRTSRRTSATRCSARFPSSVR